MAVHEPSRTEAPPCSPALLQDPAPLFAAGLKKGPEAGSFQCPVCTRTLPNALALKNHLRIHTLSPDPDDRPASPEPEDAWDRPFKCERCDRTYRHHGSLAVHRRSHEEGDFHCSVCGRHFGNLAALHVHERAHKATPMVSGAGPVVDSCFCQLCQVSFSDKTEFSEHCVLLHGSATPPQRTFQSYDPARPADPVMGPPNSAVFTCAYCGAAHNDLDSLKVHYLSHDPRPPLQDPRGPHQDPRPSLQDHQPPLQDPRASHQDPRPPLQDPRGPLQDPRPPLQDPRPPLQDPRPPLQDGALLQADSLSSPLSVASPGGRVVQSSADEAERRFKCGECGKSYRHAGSLVNHKRCHQTGHYQCSVCGKEYPHLAALHSHLRSHKGRAAPPLSAEPADWLSSEPLMDSQSFSQENLADGSHFAPDAASGLDSLDFHERFDGTALTQSHRHGNRDVCGDCGEMFSDGGKSHMCPRRQNITNGFMNNMNYHGSALPPAGGLKDSSNTRFTLPPAGGLKDTVKRLGPNDKDEEEEAEIYQCSVCGNHYASLRALRSHLRSHANNPAAPPPEPGWRMICSTCGQSFSRKQDLLNHQLIHGPQRPPEAKGGACADCGLFFSERQLLASHLCPGKKDEARRPLVEHSDKPHKCEQCGRGYRHPCSLLNHKKSHKTGVFRCLVCQKRYYNLLALKNHQRTHFDLKRHKCEECGKAFKIQKQLLNHLRLHEEHRVKGLVRSGPGAPQPGPSQLQALRADRFKKPYSSAGTSRPQKFDAAESSRRPFSCEECGKTYRHAGSLANHKNLHKVGDYHCNVCNSTYPNRLAMKNHLRLHFAHKKHNCPDCGKGFRTQRQLATHSTGGLCRGPQGPPQQMDYECDGCCEGFSTADELSAHDCPSRHLPSSSSSSSREERAAAAEDSDERPYVCDLCNCAYKHASSLLNHKHTHKTGNFRCSFCDKPYTNYMALRNHMRIHTQRKKHVCHLCGKAFRLARFLRNHQRVHEEGATPYACPACNKSFQGRSALARHRCGDAAAVAPQDERRKEPAPNEECRYTYMLSNPATLGPYAHGRSHDFSEVWTN